MDGFERHLYLYYFYGINPSLKIEIKFKSSSDDTVQGKKFQQKHWSQFCEVKQGVKVMLCVPGSKEANTNTEVVSKLEIAPLLE